MSDRPAKVFQKERPATKTYVLTDQSGEFPAHSQKMDLADLKQHCPSVFHVKYEIQCDYKLIFSDRLQKPFPQISNCTGLTRKVQM